MPEVERRTLLELGAYLAAIALLILLPLALWMLW
jgi:hypothetical protein